MNKIYLLSLGLIGLASVSIAQNNLKPQFDAKENFISEKTSFDASYDESFQQRAVGVCFDTNLWAWGRSINGGQPTYFTAFLHKEAFVPNSYGTYVNVPSNTTITVSGFNLYARSIRPDGGSVNVVAAIYAAGADSLPTGAALKTFTLSLDTTTSNFLSEWEQKVLFTSPAIVSNSFVLSIENSTALGDSIEIIRGFTGSGVADGFPAVYQADSIANGAYFRDQGGSFGARLPHFYPVVTFIQNGSFMMSASQLSGPNEDIDFTHVPYSVQGHPIWSIDGFISRSTTFYSVNGGSFSNASTGDTTITFVDETVNHNIVMNDSITMWSNPTCVISESQTLLAAAPNSVNDLSANSFNAYFANGKLNIINGFGEGTLYNITGRTVKQINLNNQFESFDVSDLNEGVYILQVGNDVIKLKL